MRKKFLVIALAFSILLAITLVYTGFYVLAQGMRINYGDRVEGEIADSNDTQTWNFDGAKADVITIQVARTGGDLIPLVTIEDSQGQILLDLDWPEEGPPTVLLSASLYHSGTHAVTIRGDDNSTGTYNLSLDVEESNDPSGTGGGILSYGDVVTGEITDTAFRQFWSFRGTQDDVIDVSMAATSGDLDASLSLTSPEGQMLYEADSGGVGTDATIFAYKLPSTGLYTLSARRAGTNFGERGTTQGTYNLALTLRTPGAEIAEITPVALTLGTEGRGQLTADAPRALYTLTAQSQALAIELDLVDPAQVVAVSVMTPNRSLLAAFSGIAPLRSGIVLPGQGGEVWVEVSAVGIREDTPIDFSLNVDQLTTAQQISRALLYDRPRQVSPLPATEESDAWNFDGDMGDVVEITVSPYGPILGDTFSVYAPDGTLLLQRPVNIGFTQPLVLRATGLYELFLGPETVQTGYSINVKQVGALGRSFEQHAAAEMRGQLTPGIDHPMSGQITAGFSDAWVFDITEPQNWLFSFTQTGSGLPPGLAIEAPDNTWLGVMLADRLPGANNIRVNLPSAGRYRAVIFEPSGQGGSTYTFYGSPVYDGALPLRTVSKSALTSQRPADFWEITVPPDSILSVKTELLSGSTLPYLHVIAPDGTLVATNAQGEAENPTILPGIPTHEGGVFQIVVSQSANQAAVTPYHISADIQTPFQTDAAITLAADSLPELSTPDPSISRVNIAEQIAPVIRPDATLLQSAPLAEQGVLQRGSVADGVLYEAWAFNARQGEMLEFSVAAFDEATSGPDVIILDQNGVALAESLQAVSATNYLMHRFQETGRYYVIVGLEHGGPYTLWLNELPEIDETVPVVLSGNIMAYGETQGGELIEADQTNRYVFYGHAADVIFARTATTQGDLRLHLSLLDTEGDVLSEAFYGETDVTTTLESVSLPENGIYQFIVSHAPGAEATTGRFALHLNLEQSGTFRGGGALTGAQVRSLSRNDSVHRWLFDAQSGEEVTIWLNSVFEGLPSPLIIQIADTAGNVFLQREANVGNNELRFEHVLLPRTGIYQAVVTGGDQQSGIYRISLERDPSHTHDNPGAIGYGETVGQVLTQANYLDVWSFAGSRGDVVSISTRTVRGDAAFISFQVRTSNGETLAIAANDTELARASVRELVLPSDGHYSIVVGNLDGTFTGEATYELTVQLENTPARSMGSVMRYGQVVEGNLYPDDPADVWLFEGQQGDVITAGISSAMIQPSLNLVSTDWHVATTAGRAEVLASVQVVDNQTAQLQSFVLPTGGAYALVVQNTTAASGGYRLSLEGQLAGAVAASPITPGYAQHAALSPDNLINAWAFTGSKGLLVTVTVTPENRSPLAPGIMLLAPDGTLLAQTDARPAQIALIEQYALTLDGTYTVIVTRALGQQGRTVGGYELDVTLTAPGSHSTFQTVYDRLERRLLDSETVAERWSFVGYTGDVVRIRAEATSGDLDPALVLYSPEGYIVAVGDDDSQGVSAEIIVTLAVDGLYEVEVSRYGGMLGTTEGNYSLLVENVYHFEPMASGPLLVYGDHVTGTINSSGSNDIWAFTGEQGDVIRVQIKFPVDDAPLSLSLRDPSGAQRIDGVRERGGAVIEAFRLPTSGFYVIEVRRPGDARAAFSPYELDVALTGTAELEIAQGGNILIGQAVTGGFDKVPATHNWFFQASGGQTVSILLSRLSGTFALQMMLVAPDGETLLLANPVPGAHNALSTGSVELPLDGLYTLLITGQDAALGSKYRLSVQPGMVSDAAENEFSADRDAFGTISSIQPQKTWSFEAQAGDTVSLRAATIDGDLLPTLLVWGPDGRPLIEGITEQTPEGKQASVTTTVPVAGTYRVTVGCEEGSGSYRLILRKQHISSHAAVAIDLAFDQSLTNYIRGTAPQLYGFQGLAGDVVGIGLHVEAGLELPELVIETESGAVLDTATVKADGEINIPAFALPQDGRYVIVVSGQEAVQYTLTLFRREPELTADAGTRNLGRNRNFREAVENAGSPTYWIFPGRMGEVVNFVVDTAGGGLRADVTLYGPHGYIASATELPGLRETTLGPVRLPDDGSYTLLVGPWLGISGGSTGQYAVRAETAPAGVSGSNGGHLVASGVTVTGGVIPEDARDVWTYNASAGEVVTIRAEQTGGDGSLVLNLVGPEGDMLATGEASAAFKGAEISSFVLSSSAVYEIVVEAALEDEASEYRLALVQSQSPVLSSMEEANGIGYGESRTAVIPAENIYQAWVFYGQKGERIASTVETENVALYLVGPGGDILLADASQVAGATFSDFVLSETGFYGLVVGGEADTEYTITLEQVSAGAVALGLLEGESAGDLTVAMPVHEWEVAPSYSGSYLIQVTSLIPHTPLDAFVLSADETLLATGALEGSTVTQVTARLEANERYVVVVSGGPAGAQGHYKISLAPAGLGGTLEAGTSEIGRINADHFTDSWSLNGQVGQTLVIDVVRVQGDFLPLVTIFDGAGTLLSEASADEDGRTTVSLELPLEGSYTVLVSRVGGGGGDYTITVRVE